MITGTMAADFSAFEKEAAKAEAALLRLESTSKGTDAALDQMVDAFDGSKVVDSMREVEDATESTGVEIESLTTQYRNFDGMLSAAGINIGRQVKAIDELANAAKKGGSELSLFGKAGLVAGAALVGWEIGKKIDELTGLSTALGNATAKLLGWSEAAGGAGSAADTMRRASAIAGREITNFAEAQEIVLKKVRETQAVMFRNVAAEQTAEMMRKYRQELTDLQKSGVLEKLKRDLEAGIIPQERLQTLYSVSGEALKLLNKDMDAHRKTVEENNKRIDEANEKYEKFLSLQEDLFGVTLIEQANEYARALGDVSNISQLLPDQMERLNKVFTAASDHMVRIGGAGSEAQQQMFMLANATSDLGAALEGIGTKFDMAASMESTIAANEKLRLEWQRSQAEAAIAVDTTTEAVREQNVEVQRLAASFTVVTQSAAQWRAQAEQLRMDADRMERSGGGLSTTMWQGQYIENLRTGAARAEESAIRQQQLDARIAGRSMPWGGGGGWSINVNAMQGINGDQIAQELVNGMRRRGVSPGGY